MGVDPNFLEEKTALLKLDNNTLKIRLVLAKMAGVDLNRFISGGYLSREDKVFARLMGLKASFRDLQSVYQPETSFKNNTFLDTPKLMEFFPYTSEIAKTLLEKFDSLYSNTEQSENV